MNNSNIQFQTLDYHWTKPETCAYVYIAPVVRKLLNNLNVSLTANILDAGCGGGRLVADIHYLGYKNVYGFDISESGISLAKKSFPRLMNNFFIHNAYDENLPDTVPQQYELIISMEVIEHLFDPKKYLCNIKKWLVPNGYFILTTPYHGFFKNL